MGAGRTQAAPLGRVRVREMGEGERPGWINGLGVMVLLPGIVTGWESLLRFGPAHKVSRGWSPFRRQRGNSAVGESEKVKEQQHQHQHHQQGKQQQSIPESSNSVAPTSSKL